VPVLTCTSYHGALSAEGVVGSSNAAAEVFPGILALVVAWADPPDTPGPKKPAIYADSCGGCGKVQKRNSICPGTCYRPEPHQNGSHPDPGATRPRSHTHEVPLNIKTHRTAPTRLETPHTCIYITIQPPPIATTLGIQVMSTTTKPSTY
jgi:hypothetical protein